MDSVLILPMENLGDSGDWVKLDISLSYLLLQWFNAIIPGERISEVHAGTPMGT